MIVLGIIAVVLLAFIAVELLGLAGILSGAGTGSGQKVVGGPPAVSKTPPPPPPAPEVRTVISTPTITPEMRKAIREELHDAAVQLDKAAGV